MTLFGERFGFNQPAPELPMDAAPSSLRNGLWDVMRQYPFCHIGWERSPTRSASYAGGFRHLSEQIQFDLLRLSVDDLSFSPSIQLQKFKDYFFHCTFWKVYEFIEFIIKVNQNFVVIDVEKEFVDACNYVLERERSQFRLLGQQFVRVSNAEEMQEIEEAITNSSSAAVATHISTAARLLSDPNQSDYRNSIKESVSAVEAAVRFVTGKKTVGVARPLKFIEDEFSLHKALRDGFEKIFAFSSDEQGVRHALMDESKITYSDARFMLISCSAFANYLVALKVEQSK